MPEHNNQDPSQQPPRDSIIPENHDGYLRSDFMQAAIANPGQLYDQLVESGVEEQEAEVELHEVRMTIAEKIMVPEFVAQASNEMVKRVTVEKEELIPEVNAQLRPIIELAEDKTLAKIDTEREDANSAFRIVRDYSEGDDIDEYAVRGAISHLQDFAGQYRLGINNINDKGFAAGGSAGRLSDTLEFAQSRIAGANNRLAQEINGVPGQGVVADLDLLDAAQQRGSTSIAEHQAACDNEYDQNRDTVQQSARSVANAAQLAGDLRGPIRTINSILEEDMPAPNHLEMAIDFVSRSVHLLQEHGPVMKSHLDESIHGLDQVMRRVENATNEAIGGQKRLESMMGSAQHAVRQLAQAA